jgi:superfamily II DNA or RNA helicase
MSDGIPEWDASDSEIARAVQQYSSETLAAYREAPRFVEEHANLERAAVEGGYGRRQLFELVQNGADELVESAGRVQVVLTEDALYCANEGRPLTVAGVGALLSSHLSSKRGVEIGRFGLGFKSVLAITTTPEIFSRSGSLRFDPEDAAHRIREIVPTAKRTPVLRIATPIDAMEEASDDPFLGELMTWATTVVRLARNTPDSSWLADDLERFPSQFLLFSPHVEKLVLDNQETLTRRTISAAQEGDEFVLVDDGESRWRVFATEHHPSDVARLDAGAMADRDRIPLVWAVPTRRGRRGEFWAFFPTLDQTTLSGVVNAPWKLNEDRTRIIDGPFNAELIERLSALIMENLQPLCSPDDPGVLLELMPARGREAAGWADAELTNRVNELAHTSRTLPDQEARLRFPRELSLHPAEIPRPTLAIWAEQSTRPVDWVHVSADTRDRRARVEMYMDTREPASVGEWLETLMSDEEPVAGSVAALRVASSLVRMDPKFFPLARKAKILIDEAGVRCSAEDGIFRRAPIPVDIEARYVHGEIEAAADEYLRNLEIGRVDTERLLEKKLREARHAWKPEDWDVFWALVRETSQRAVLQLLQDASVDPLNLRVRNLKGDYSPLGLLLLPGEIAQEGSVDDANAVIDTHFHGDELATLRLLGATSGPSRNGGSRSEPWFSEYQLEAETEYVEELSKSGAAPNRDYLGFRDRAFAGPLTPLMMLSPATRARYTAAVLRVVDDLDDWTFGHKTQARYPERPWPNPVVYMVRKHGILETSLGLTPQESAVSPAMEALSAVLPVARIHASVAEALGLPNDPSLVGDDQWAAALATALTVDDDGAVGLTYATAAAAGVAAPLEIRCRVSHSHDLRPTKTVTVVSDPDLVVLLDQTAEPYVRVETAEQALLLVERWSLRDADTAVRSEVVAVESGEAEPLADAFPMLRPRLDPQQRALLLQPCTEIRVDRFTENGRISESKRTIVEGDTIFYRDDIDQRGLLKDVAGTLGMALTEADVDAIFRNLAARQVKKLRAAIRRAPDDVSRLLLAVGSDALRARLPRAVLDSVETIEGELDDHGVAGLALVLYGAQVLQEYSDVLDEQGLEPPQRWAGSRAAVAFARDLGFGIEYGGFETRSLERQLELEGPPEIGPLHDYQEIVVEDIRDLIRGRGGLRGLLSLPTGAGKTRVTIEALIDAMEAREVDSPILWVAQTQELCEQAVETWSELWRAKGPRRRLTISRLRSSFEAEQAEHGDQVVVATVAKLDAGVFEKKSYGWLSRASCIVVDEAHTSVGPSYTRLLEWQGMPRNEDRAPLIGLTATPFRGTNEAETKRLAARYGNRRLDLRALGGEDAYPHLQQIGILSHVDHELLPGADIHLSPDELQRLKDLRRLPDEAARRLAADTGRNRTLLESIAHQDDDWPVLLFCVSVEHANTMAALLTRAAIPAAAISAETGKGLRRHYIDRFRRGDIRVLTNFNVLAAGFDAPRVRAVYIARPTYVPNVYQQMIGRGLRGERNGGTERCLLVNVADNVEQFGEQLAFHEFDYLWNGAASKAVR